MPALPRLYQPLLDRHFASWRQMALLTGPRQVGKTTLCTARADLVLNWDVPEDRRVVLAGPDAVAARLELARLRSSPPTVAFDELHKHPRWRAFLKGFFDGWGARCRILVTGSSRLDVFRRAGDSLVGRYFQYRIHPFSVGELLAPRMPAFPLPRPRPVADPDWAALLEHGGFPEPFTRRDPAFTALWRRQRRDLILREDARDLTQIHALAQMEVLADILAERSARPLVYSSLAADIGVAPDTARRWTEALAGLHVGFFVRPWFRNVAKSLRKEPRWFLRDWAAVTDPGARAETFVGAHLLKAVEAWTDAGAGEFELRYLRDVEKHEVDFVVIRDRRPWCLVEVKVSETALAPDLRRFQEALRIPHAFQVVLDLPFVGADPFAVSGPVVVPARTFLAMLP